jgi:hypothetical protein
MIAWIGYFTAGYNRLVLGKLIHHVSFWKVDSLLGARSGAGYKPNFFGGKNTGSRRGKTPKNTRRVLFVASWRLETVAPNSRSRSTGKQEEQIQVNRKP